MRDARHRDSTNHALRAKRIHLLLLRGLRGFSLLSVLCVTIACLLCGPELSPDPSHANRAAPPTPQLERREPLVLDPGVPGQSLEARGAGSPLGQHLGDCRAASSKFF